MDRENEQIRGALLGLAWGDVLGCPVEGWRSGDIAAIYDGYHELPEAYPLDRLQLKGKKVLKRLRPLGLHSDDTQQALGLLLVGLAPEGWQMESWVRVLVEGLEQGAWRGFGRNFSSAVHRLRGGMPAERAGSTSAGIGAAMRIAPLGALYRDDPVQLAFVSMSSSLVTHGDIRAAAMACAVALATRRLLLDQHPKQIRSELPDELEVIETQWLEGYEEWTIDRQAGHQVSEGLRQLLSSHWSTPEELRRRVSRLARPYLARGFHRAHPNQGFVLLGGAHALALALQNHLDPEETLLDLIRQGYDTDTVAAICGGLLGARYGTDWIPLARLLDRDRLDDYAHALISRKAPPEDLQSFLQHEAHWSRLEAEFQAPYRR